MRGAVPHAGGLVSVCKPVQHHRGKGKQAGLVLGEVQVLALSGAAAELQSTDKGDGAQQGGDEIGQGAERLACLLVFPAGEL
jgi:hypothetical protein